MSMKDWTGNKASTFTCLGASNHVEHDRAKCCVLRLVCLGKRIYGKTNNRMGKLGA